jgi:hypothetical protein
MKKKTIFDRLDELAYYAHEHIPWLNLGGCGVFAHMVGDRLYRSPEDVELLGYAVNGQCRAPVPSVTVTYFPTTVDVSIDELRLIVKDRWCARDWNRAGLKLRHIGVELLIDGMEYIFDSRGIWPSTAHEGFEDRVPGRLERTEMLLMALQPLGWNSDFDREQLPYMKKLIKAFLPYPGEERQYEKFRADLRKKRQADKESMRPKVWIPPPSQWASIPDRDPVIYQELRELRQEIVAMIPM